MESEDCPNGLAALVPQRKSGAEHFQLRSAPLPFTLLEFWQWSASDLVSNVTRGCLAEFIVAKALGIPVDSVRDDWKSFDLVASDGLKIEVKSAAYVQSWFQKALSPIRFRVGQSLAWSRETNVFDREPKRQADVYVFAVLAHKDGPTLDPLNLDQWEFWVLPTRVLDERKRSQHSIALRSLEMLCGRSVGFHGLPDAVTAAGSSRGV